jgi:hypothetical protein
MSSSSPALIRILLLPLMLVIATGLGGSANAATTLSPPAALNHNAVLDSDFDAFPDVATDRDGTWIAVWDAAASDTTIDCSGSSDGTCGPDREILYAISTDAGESWSDATFLNTDAESDTASDLKPLIATDRNGTWMVVWSRNDEAAVATSTDAGQTWSTPQVLSDVELTFGYVIETMDLITDRQGTWMLVWSSNGQGTGGDYDIFVVRSFDGGATWSAPISVNPTDNPVYDDQEPAIATDGNGNWIVVWESDNQDGGKGADPDILASRSSDQGTSWTTPVAVNTDATTDSSLFAQDRTPDIATDGRGNWVVVWLEFSDDASPTGTDEDIVWSRSTNLGASWSAPQGVEPNAAADSRFEYNPVIETDGHGSWTAAWEGFPALADTDLLVATSTSDGAAWGNLQALNTQALSDNGDDTLVALAADDAGNWVAVWNSNDDLEGTVFADADIFVTDFRLSLVYPFNDLPLDARPILPGRTWGTFFNAGTEGAASCGLGGEGDVWYRFHLPDTGTLSVDTCGSFVDQGVDTVVSIHTAAPGTTGNEVACSDDWSTASPRPCDGTRDSSLEAPIGPEPVWIRVARYPGTAEGAFVLNVGFAPEPGLIPLLGGGLLGLVGLERRRSRGRGRHFPS